MPGGRLLRHGDEAVEYTYDFAQQPVGQPAQYWLDGERLSRAFCAVLPSRMADLLDLAIAVYTADRMSPRDFRRERTGQRRIHLRLPVREPSRWADADVLDRLHDLLSWLSEDVWSFEFVTRHGPPWSVESQGFLFRLPPDPPITVALFSGGLDSLAGLAAHAQEEPDGHVVLVSGYTNDRLASQQRLQVHGIRAAWQGIGQSREKTHELCHLAVPFGIYKSGGRQEEPSQRTRALVFLTLGVAAALQAGADTLWVYENGVGALNLPLNATQLGVDSYRGVHPRSLQMARRLFELVLERSIKVRNRFVFHTKAEMCAALLPSGVSHLIPHTVSCDGFPQRVLRQSQCGLCTSCILRRQSLYASGLGHVDAAGGYRYDVVHPRAALTLGQMHGLLVMRDQVNHIALCLSSADPWRALVERFPHLLAAQAVLVEEVLSPAEVRARLMRMYRAYIQEWAGFPANPSLAA